MARTTAKTGKRKPLTKTLYVIDWLEWQIGCDAKVLVYCMGQLKSWQDLVYRLKQLI